MKIILSPAKNMKTDIHCRQELALPMFLNRTGQILNVLNQLEKDQLRKIWKCSESKIDELQERFQKANLSKDLTPAIFAYDGLVYKNIDPDSLDASQIDYLQEHLRILSGFYGVLHPLDGILQYRLEMQSNLKIDQYKNLYDFWGKSLYEEVMDSSRVVINLASKEYSKCIEPYLKNQDTFITIAFFDKVNGEYVHKNTYSKMARGLMVRYLAMNNITEIEEIKNFNSAGYQFNLELSTDSLFVFTR